VSGYLPCFQQRKPKKNQQQNQSRVSPRRRGTFFCFAKRKYPKKRRPAARRIPAPAIPPRARLNLRRASVTPLKQQPLKTLSGTSASARADGTGAASNLLFQQANDCDDTRHILFSLLSWPRLETKSSTMLFVFQNQLPHRRHPCPHQACRRVDAAAV
jgi:hypothetical protein